MRCWGLLLVIRLILSKSIRTIPRVAVVIAPGEVGAVAPVLLQRLRLLEEQDICSPLALTFDSRSAKRLGKLVGEEYNELVLTPSVSIEDAEDAVERLRSLVESVKCVVVTRKTAASRALRGLWTVFQPSETLSKSRSNLASLLKLTREVGVMHYLLFRESPSENCVDELPDELLALIESFGKPLSLGQATFAEESRLLTLTRVREDREETWSRRVEGHEPSLDVANTLLEEIHRLLDFGKEQK